MVRLIIRDDDCNFFTKPEDIQIAYSDIPDFPVSFAVVPMVVDVIGGCPETKGNTIPTFIGENQELVNYLRKRIQEGSCDILLHGIYHEYKYPNGVKTPEMIWREYETKDLKERIGNNKKALEEIFGAPINCFVAPSNKIKVRGLRAVYKNGMHFSGIIPLSFDRDFSLNSVKNYVLRWLFRILKGMPYPGVLDYGTHVELNACNRTSYDFLVKMFHYCDKQNLPMAINVHYWHIRDNKEHYKGFFDFIKYAIAHGAEPSRMRDCLPK